MSTTINVSQSTPSEEYPVCIFGVKDENNENRKNANLDTDAYFACVGDDASANKFGCATIENAAGSAVELKPENANGCIPQTTHSRTELIDSVTKCYMDCTEKSVPTIGTLSLCPDNNATVTMTATAATSAALPFSGIFLLSLAGCINDYNGLRKDNST
ncbi:uncharacterized protein LOC122322552 [Drosophila grimshawi]|uniref:uncharacterized protein LOC122322552 n=1 Tax=Drosophila grimshawi TaxID=7222 RepID=UPI001C933968|nr:uncharacterized protein LOC122322552 [Drosophila grimshawi]